MWSFSEIIVKLLQGMEHHIGPVSLSFTRFFFGGIFMIILMLLKGGRKGTHKMGELAKRNKVSICISSMFGLGFSNIIYFIGLQMTQANVGSALYTTYPLFISIYSIWILGEKSNIRRKLIGYFIGFTGTAILMTNFRLDLFIAEEYFIGNILLVLAAIIWSLYSVLGKRIIREAKDIENAEIKYTAISFLLATVPVVFFLLFSSELGGFFQYNIFEWLLILIQGFFTTGYGMYLFYMGLRKIEMTKGISLALLKPIWVTIFAFFILGEQPTLALLVSIPLVSIAVLIINTKKKAELKDKSLSKPIQNND
jgi:drug/metabolite transporter (DMT)-like permease